MDEDRTIIETARRYPNEQIPPINEGESEADYFRRLLDGSERAKEAVKTHETWKRRHLNGLREMDCMQRILIVLGELLKSDFLRYDWFDTGFPKADREQAVNELREQGFEELLQTEGADWKFALLGQLRNQQDSRIVIEERRAGFYINEMHDKLSMEAVEAFCRFVTFTQLAYREIDQLSDRELEECRKKMLAAIEPLREHVKQAYKEQYDVMLDKILLVGGLQKKLKLVSPNTFEGGYNKKLTCNLVGVLCREAVYDMNPKQADGYIYGKPTCYKYINNFAACDTTDSELTREEINAIKAVIKKHT